MAVVGWLRTYENYYQPEAGALRAKPNSAWRLARVVCTVHRSGGCDALN